jgi:hypothetical protein
MPRWSPAGDERVLWQSQAAACSPAQLTSFFLVVASCGLLPRTTRPGPRLRTAYPAVAILPLRDTNSSSRVARRAGPVANPVPRASWTWSAPPWTNVAPTARALPTPSSRGCGLASLGLVGRARRVIADCRKACAGNIEFLRRGQVRPGWSKHECFDAELDHIEFQNSVETLLSLGLG